MELGATTCNSGVTCNRGCKAAVFTAGMVVLRLKKAPKRTPMAEPPLPTESEDRGPDGRWLPGCKAPPGAGRPPGALNRFTKTLREQAIEGLGDITEFVRELKHESPQSAAALLARMLPPPREDEAEGGNGGS